MKTYTFALSCVLALTLVGCGSTPKPVLTPTQAQQVTAYLDTIVASAEIANAQTPPLVSSATLAIVKTVVTQAETDLAAATQSPQAIGLAALDQVQAKLSASDYATVKPYLDAARVLLTELQ